MGEVQIRCLIDSDGVVKDVILLSGHPLLASAAAANVKQWRFQPPQGNDRPEANLKYTFRLVSPGTEGTEVDSLMANMRIGPDGTVIVTAPYACVDFVPCGAEQKPKGK